MKKCSQLETYYDLFSLIVENPRITPNDIACRFGYSGRGRRSTTFLRHIQNMYEKGISFTPKLKMRAFQNHYSCIYFCRKKDKKNIFNIFLDLYNDKRIDYVILLSGNDFLITSTHNDLKFEEYSLVIEEKSVFYDQIYTIPRGWNLSTEAALDLFLRSDFEEGRISRGMEHELDWDQSDWDIYHSMRNNIRCKFSDVVKETGIYHKKVKSDFYNRVLPNCLVAHYFFPKGYNFYMKMLIKMESSYEKSIVESLSALPCTTYVFTLDDSLVITLFHDNEEKVLQTLKKMEEIGIIDDYLLYIPIVYSL